jgi:hypothetical protein
MHRKGLGDIGLLCKLLAALDRDRIGAHLDPLRVEPRLSLRMSNSQPCQGQRNSSPTRERLYTPGSGEVSRATQAALSSGAP